MRLGWKLALGVAAVTWPMVIIGGVSLEWFATRQFDDSIREFALAFMDAGGRERCERDPTRFAFDGFRPPPAMRPGIPVRPFRLNRDPDRPDGTEGMDVGPPGAFPPLGEGPEPTDGMPVDRPRPPPRPRAGDDAPVPGPPAARDAQGRPPAAGRDTRIWAYRADLTSANPRAPAIPSELARAIRSGESSAGRDWKEEEPDGRVRFEGREIVVRTAAADGPCAILLVERARTAPFFPRSTYVIVGGAFTAFLALYALLLTLPLVRRVRRLAAAVKASAATRYAALAPVNGNDELAELSRAFNDAGLDVRAHIRALEARETTLRDFVSNTAHDVAIPLTVLQGHLVTMRDAAGAGKAADSAAVRDAVEESHYIACLLQNLSAAAKLEASAAPLRRDAVDLSALVERVVARHRPVAEGADVSLEYAIPLEPITVAGDVTLLEQAVSNVVHNAIRYQRPAAERGLEGNVAVVLESAPRDPSRFVLRVIDDGPGISDDELPHVLERSFRGREARTRALHGAGLGLPIAHDVMNRHGFLLRLAKSEAGGLEVTFSGPATTANASRNGPRDAVPPPS